MKVDFIVTVAALCLVQICLSIYCYKIWQQKERWKQKYHEQTGNNEELLEALYRVVSYVKELEGENSQLLDDVDEEMELWNKSKHPPIDNTKSVKDDK